MGCFSGHAAGEVGRLWRRAGRGRLLFLVVSGELKDVYWVHTEREELEDAGGPFEDSERLVDSVAGGRHCRGWVRVESETNR